MSYFNPDSDQKVFVFALSTCVHCRRAKDLLDDMGVNYGHVEVDLLDENVVDEAMEEMERYNPALTFPTIVFSTNRVIVGYKADDIRQEVEKLRNK